MGNLDLIGRMGIAKMGHIGDAITGALVNFDPATASAAQISIYRTNCNNVATRVAEAEQAVQAATAKVKNLQDRLDRDRSAAISIRDHIKAETNEATIHQLTASVGTVIAQMKEIGGDDMKGETSGTLFDARTDMTQASADYEEWHTLHQHAVEQLTTAETTLKHAQDDMVRATHEAERAKITQQQAEMDAGLRNSLNGGSPALAAMTAQADKARLAARAATLQTQELRRASGTGTDADAVVAATLAAAKPANTVLDDLDRL